MKHTKTGVMEFSVIRRALEVEHVDNLTDWPDWLDEGYMNNSKNYKIRVASSGSSFLSRLKLVFTLLFASSLFFLLLSLLAS